MATGSRTNAAMLYAVFVGCWILWDLLQSRVIRCRSGNWTWTQDPDSEAPTDTGTSIRVSSLSSFEQNVGWYVTVMQVMRLNVSTYYMYKMYMKV